MNRSTYEDSCAELQRRGILDEGPLPPMPAGQPKYDDPEPLGVQFFRTSIEGDLSGMTLPRTFFGQSEVCDASFKNTDLSESNLCWCDFARVDFTDGSLRASDLRASTFEDSIFARCDLRGADLRMSSFEGCDFADAQMSGTKLTREQGEEMRLSPQQKAAIDWQESEGEEPDGG